MAQGGAEGVADMKAKGAEGVAKVGLVSIKAKTGLHKAQWSHRLVYKVSFACCLSFTWCLQIHRAE